MKYGLREICDVVLRAKAKMSVGNKTFYKDEPVIYFDSLKTSTLEGAATTVYAQGGRGNSRLIAWEGERTVTFTMEDALISTASLAILTGADVVDATKDKPIIVHATEIVALETATTAEGAIPATITLGEAASGEADVYVMFLNDEGDPVTEPFIYKKGESGNAIVPVRSTEKAGVAAKAVLVDYYVEKESGQQITITADKFGGNFYLEASTLFRTEKGVDLPAEFIIPNCKVQSNFTFTMASSGDPSTFTFTMDAFPDYTRFDPSKKVLSVIQVVTDDLDDGTEARTATPAV